MIGVTLLNNDARSNIFEGGLPEDLTNLSRVSEEPGWI
jgi:hypothetical protein